MDDCATGKIQRSEFGEPAAAPHPVGDGRVDAERPERDEAQIRAEPHALDNRTRYERCGNDRKGALVRREEKVGDGAFRLESDVAQKSESEIAQQSRTP